MNLTFSLSLEQRALTNIAITLWSQDCVRDMLSKSALHTLNDSWKGIEKAVIEKSFKLRLPEMFKDKLLNCIVRVGKQIISWVDFHYCDYGFVTKLPMFVWTSIGTINNIKTAKVLVMSGTLTGDASFTLACMYCLEDEIKYCLNMFELSLPTSKLNSLHFVSYWSDYMDENRLERCSSNSNLYPCLILESTRSGNEAATRYFFQKVNMKRDNFVMVLAKLVASKICTLKKNIFLERYSGVLLFLLSKMNAQQQSEIFASHACAVLICLLVWPWQSLFLETLKDKWNFLSKKDYNMLLHYMVYMMDTNPNLHKLFGKFWQQSPETYKQFSIVRCCVIDLIFNLYRSGDEENVKLIFKDISISNRKILLSSVGSEKAFVYLVSCEKWNSVEFLIQKCLSNWDRLIVYRNYMKKYVTELQDESVKEYQWDKFFQLFDSYIFRYNKKRPTENNCISSKKRLIYNPMVYHPPINALKTNKQ